MLLENITPEEFEFLDKAAIAFVQRADKNSDSMGSTGNLNKDRLAVRAYKFAEELLRERREHNPAT